MQVVFNPKDTNTFASASLDRTIKVWSIGQPTPNFTLEGHDKGVNCVDYFNGGLSRAYVSTTTRCKGCRLSVRKLIMQTSQICTGKILLRSHHVALSMIRLQVCGRCTDSRVFLGHVTTRTSLAVWNNIPA